MKEEQMRNHIPEQLTENIKRFQPKIYDSILLFWGYKDFFEYVNTLLLSNTKKHHAELPETILRDLYNLQSAHDRLFPEFAKERIKKQEKEQMYRDAHRDKTP
jgi:hypothetical protein